MNAKNKDLVKIALVSGAVALAVVWASNNQFMGIDKVTGGGGWFS